MIRFLNIIYYFIWQFWLISGKGIDKFTDFTLKPFKWLFLKIPFVRNRYIKLYGSVENAGKLVKDTVDYGMYNEEWGFMMHFTWCIYGGVIAFYIWGLYFVLAHYFPILLEFFDRNKIPCALGFAGLAGLITYPVSYRKDVFKKHFRELEKIRGWKRFTYKAMTFFLVFGSFMFWLWALGFAHHKPIF